MAIFTITGDDTLTIFGRIFNDLAQDDVTTIAFPNEIVKIKTGKNQNTIFARDETGNNANLTLKLMRGSSDDQFMQQQQAASDANFSATVLSAGEFVKIMGDGQGNTVRDVYSLQGGMIKKRVEGKDNTSGDTVQATVTYEMIFATAKRIIQ
ncbi:MAG: hypothetical protein ACRD4H_03715 [Candidatus Acidiferrales bacterium]